MKSDATLVSEFEAHFPAIAQELGRANLEVFLDGASVQEFAPNRIVIRDRMPVDFLYFVLDGTLAASIEIDKQSKKLGTVKPGEWMGEISVLSGEFLASATITTEVPCKLLRVHHLSFEKLITENEAIAQVLLQHFINLMAKRFRSAVNG
ncbi:MAG TPA: cyclic nucleotide-binding domain-containing protein [Oxalicibacterium sp.]|nr:cyclic nucleotide-binding domain-containing protein [Oxalicibacterium sp.]